MKLNFRLRLIRASGILLLLGLVLCCGSGTTRAGKPSGSTMGSSAGRKLWLLWIRQHRKDLYRFGKPLERMGPTC